MIVFFLPDFRSSYIIEGPAQLVERILIISVIRIVKHLIISGNSTPHQLFSTHFGQAKIHGIKIKVADSQVGIGH